MPYVPCVPYMACMAHLWYVGTDLGVLPAPQRSRRDEGPALFGSVGGGRHALRVVRVVVLVGVHVYLVAHQAEQTLKCHELILYTEIKWKLNNVLFCKKVKVSFT